MATAPRPMITVTDTANAEPQWAPESVGAKSRRAAAVAAPTEPGSDLQHFGVWSGFKLAGVRRSLPACCCIPMAPVSSMNPSSLNRFRGRAAFVVDPVIAEQLPA